MHITRNKLLNIFLSPLLVFTKWLGRTNPELLIRIRYYYRFHKKLNLKNPKTLNEKILYLSLKTDTSSWTRLADKYAVREYIKDRGYEDILTKLYAYWRSEEEVDFDVLPNSFVIKSVQGCGDVIIVKNKSQLNIKSLMRPIHKMLHERYGALEGGSHYLRINPGIIVEELLPIIDNDFPVDYKFWCFSGKVVGIMTCSSRTSDSVCLGFYDTDWAYHPEFMLFSKEHSEEQKPLPRPQGLEKMILISEKLSEGFPCVRVDLYNFEGKIFFGEMTFTSLGGMMDYYSDLFQNMAGSMIDISNVTTSK